MPEERAARPAAPKKRPVIGVLSDDVVNGYSQPVLAAISEAAAEFGADLISFVESLRPEATSRGERLLTEVADPARLDGLLVLPVGHDLGRERLEAYYERFRPLPICSIPEVSAPWCSRVFVDNEPGMRAVVAHTIVTHGCRKIGFVCGPDRSEEAALRLRIYREVLRENGIPYDPALIAPGNYITESGAEAVRLLLDERKVSLDALVCANDAMALGALEELRSREIRVPEQIAIVGFDDIDVARYTAPPLTTVRQPLRKLGRAALLLLLEQIREGKPPRWQMLGSELVVRESCGCGAELGEELYSSHRSGPSLPLGCEALNAQIPMIAEAIRSLGIAGAPESPWQEAICAAFAAEISHPKGIFNRQCRRVVESVAARRGDIGEFQKVITLLWRWATHCLPLGSPEWDRADTLLHTARALVGTVAEHVQAARLRRFEDFAYRLARTGNALALVPNRPQISAVLAQELPQYGINDCYVCLYELGSAGVRLARLVAGCRDGRPLSLPNDGIEFPERRLLPDQYFPESGQYLVGPLNRSGTSPGYAVFSRGPLEGLIYESMMTELGGTVRRLQALEQLLFEASRREILERERMQEELAIATRIQTGILPRDFRVQGLEISALMLPATEVGGDYYDIIPVEGGCWIGIGDVAGHGVSAGLVMLMLQSATSSLLHKDPGASPRQVLSIVNSVLFENIRQRMGQDEHATLTLLHYQSDGQLTFAGAHEDILVYRARHNRTEAIPTEGTWVGAIRDIEPVSSEQRCQLEPGDILLLHTDGVTEARNAGGELFGIERLQAALTRLAHEPVREIRDAVVTEVDTWMARQRDDLTLVVARYVPK